MRSTRNSNEDVHLDKPLYSEENWYLIHKRDILRHSSYPGDSMIVHKCPQLTISEPDSSITCYYRVYTIEPYASMICWDCNTTPSEALEGLWCLHNFNCDFNNTIYTR